jgi:hypothetical protein
MLCKYWVQCDFVCFVVDADHKKLSVRHSLPSVTLPDSLYVPCVVLCYSYNKNQHTRRVAVAKFPFDDLHLSE